MQLLGACHYSFCHQYIATHCYAQAVVGNEALLQYFLQCFNTFTGGQEQEGIYYQGITGMKADMSGARTIPKLLELQEECLARDGRAGGSSSEDSSDDESDTAAIPGLACLEAPAIPAALRQHNLANTLQLGTESQDDDESVQSSDNGSSQSGSDTQSAADTKLDRKAHKKAVKEANRERRKHKMPKHVKKKKMAKSHKK